MRHVWMGCLICVLLLMGCDRSSSDPSKSGGAAEGSSKITIVASVQTEADMAQRLAGNWADVSWLVEAGRRPEQAEVDAENRQRAGRAAAVVIAGPWDTWALANLSADARTAHVVEPSRMPSARDADPNAYLWLDPPVMREMVGRLRGRLGVLDPKRDAALSASAAAYVAEVDAVDREFAAALGALRIERPDLADVLDELLRTA